MSEPAGWSEAGPEPSGSAAAGFRVPARSPARPGAAFPSTSSARPRWGAVRRRGPPTVALPGGEHHRAAEGCEHAGRALGGGRVPGRLAHPMTCATWARGPLGGGASGVSAGPPLRSFSSTRGRSRRAAGGSLAARTRAGLGGAPLGSVRPPPRRRAAREARDFAEGSPAPNATRPMPAQARLAQCRPSAGEMRGQTPAKCPAAERATSATGSAADTRPQAASRGDPGDSPGAGGEQAARTKSCRGSLSGARGPSSPRVSENFPTPRTRPHPKKKTFRNGPPVVKFRKRLVSGRSCVPKHFVFREGVSFRNISYSEKPRKKKREKKKNAFENALKARAGMSLPPGPGGGGSRRSVMGERQPKIPQLNGALAAAKAEDTPPDDPFALSNFRR